MLAGQATNLKAACPNLDLRTLGGFQYLWAWETDPILFLSGIVCVR